MRRSLGGSGNHWVYASKKQKNERSYTIIGDSLVIEPVLKCCGVFVTVTFDVCDSTQYLNFTGPHAI
jgi:hypothetical protein